MFKKGHGGKIFKMDKIIIIKDIINGAVIYYPS